MKEISKLGLALTLGMAAIALILGSWWKGEHRGGTLPEVGAADPGGRAPFPEELPPGAGSDRPRRSLLGRQEFEEEPSGGRSAAPGRSDEVSNSQPSARPVGLVSVRFTDERRAPLARVELRVSSDRGERGGEIPGWETQADDDGVARLELPMEFRTLPARAITLEACLDGFATDRRVVRTTPGRELWLDDWALAHGGSVEGRVVDSSGRGLANTQVACAREGIVLDWERDRREALEDLWRPGAQTTSDALGGFRLDHVPAGRILLVAVAPDRPAALSEPVEVPRGGLAVGVRLAMEEADGGTTLTGIVREPGGRAVPHAPLLVVAPGAESRQFAGADGRFELWCDDKQPRDLTALDPVGRLREATRLGVVPGTKDIELCLRAAPELAVRVRTASGAPLERFAVAVLSEARRQALAFFAESERPGGAMVLGAPAQDFSIEVRAGGFQPRRLGPFSGDAPPAEVECVLAPAGELRGVVSAGGRPVAGARVGIQAALERADTYNGFPLRMRPEVEAEVESDAAGAFALGLTRAGTFHVLAEAEGLAPTELGPITLTSEEVRVIEIELGLGGTLEVRVRSTEAAPVMGLPVAFSRGDGRARTQRTDADGRIVLDHLTPGPWQVELTGREIDPLQGLTVFGSKPVGEFPGNCRVFEGEVMRLDLWLEGKQEKACRIAGRLTIDGRPAEGWAGALEGTQALEEQAFVEPGSFRLALDEPGPCRLTLVPEHAPAEAMLVLIDSVDLTEGEQHWSLEFETGTLDGVLASGSLGDTLLMYRWERGTLQGFAPLVPDDEGHFNARCLPAGHGALVRVDPNRPLEEQEPVFLQALEIEPGRHHQLELRLKH